MTLNLIITGLILIINKSTFMALLLLQMHKKHTVQSLLIGKDHFMVTVYPNVDYAFIVALIVILNEINSEEKGSESGLLDEVLFGGV
jgi:hypothetical protein